MSSSFWSAPRRRPGVCSCECTDQLCEAARREGQLVARTIDGEVGERGDGLDAHVAHGRGREPNQGLEPAGLGDASLVVGCGVGQRRHVRAAAGPFAEQRRRPVLRALHSARTRTVDAQVGQGLCRLLLHRVRVRVQQRDQHLHAALLGHPHLVVGCARLGDCEHDGGPGAGSGGGSGRAARRRSCLPTAAPATRTVDRQVGQRVGRKALDLNIRGLREGQQQFQPV